jgi:flagellar M-ring protein FliF
MANVENIEAENAIVSTRSGIITSSSNAIDKIREGIDQPGFRRAFPTLLASVTAVAAIILYWGMQQPDMTTLYSSLPEAQKAKVLESLRNMGVEVELDPVTGDVLVPTDAYHQSRISLAAQGLPEFSGSPSDAVDDLPLGVSRSVEGLNLSKFKN